VRQTLATVADRALEVTIFGSFTKIGFMARESLEGWEEPTQDMTGQTVVVTGATSGIGNATASGLLALGADVHITSRDLTRATEAASQLDVANAPTSQGRAFPHQLDTADYASVRSLASSLRDLDGGIDVLIHNAGALTDEFQVSETGTELTLASHLIGPYLLTTELKPALNSGARVLFMSSGGMYSQGLDVDRIEMHPGNYRGAVAYARAKRGQVEMVAHLGPLWAPEVLLHAVHPGWVDTPGVDAGLPGFGKIMGPVLRDADQGADTMIWLAAQGAANAAPGQFWLDRRTRGTSYLPGTGTNDSERQRLVDWLDEVTQSA